MTIFENPSESKVVATFKALENAIAVMKKHGQDVIDFNLSKKKSEWPCLGDFNYTIYKLGWKYQPPTCRDKIFTVKNEN